MARFALRVFTVCALLCILAGAVGIFLLEAGIVRPFPVPEPENNAQTPAPAEEQGVEELGARIESIPLAPALASIPEHTGTYGDYALTVPDQPPGERFYATGIRFPIDGWLAVYAVENGAPDFEHPIGTLFFPSEPKSDQSGGGTLELPLLAGRDYVAAMHGNTGELSFDFRTDPMLRDAAKSPFIVRFRVRTDAVLP